MAPQSPSGSRSASRSGSLPKLPPGFRRIKGLVHLQNDTSDIELSAAKAQARALREEKGEEGRPRYLGAEVVNKGPERRTDGTVVRFGRVFVARREDNPGAEPGAEGDRG